MKIRQDFILAVHCLSHLECPERIVGPLSQEGFKNSLNTGFLDMGEFIQTKLCGIVSLYRFTFCNLCWF